MAALYASEVGSSGVQEFRSSKEFKGVQREATRRIQKEQDGFLFGEMFRGCQQREIDTE